MTLVNPLYAWFPIEIVKVVVFNDHTLITCTSIQFINSASLLAISRESGIDIKSYIDELKATNIPLFAVSTQLHLENMNIHECNLKFAHIDKW